MSDDENVLAETVARQWLDRYGVVMRDWWKRERPAVSWRAIYRELKRLEFRGDVRRGYFVRGLAGAQFALPSAVELLRTSGPRPAPNDNQAPAQQPIVIMAASDPVNPYALAAAGMVQSRSAELTRKRSRGALLATRMGEVILVAEARGGRITIQPGVSLADLTDGARALASRLTDANEGRRDITIETIDGVPAAGSPYAAAFSAAGFRATSGGLRYYAPHR